MALADDALLDDLEHPVEQRLGEVLAPGAGLAQGAGQFQVELGQAQLAVGEDAPGEVVLAELAAHLGIEGRGEGAEMPLRQRQAGGHGMPAELADQPRVARGHGVQRIADVQARHRARRALEAAVAGVGEGDGRAVVALLQARGEDADHALVPVRVEQAQAEGHFLHRQFLELGQGLALHALLDGLAVLVELVELHRHVAGQGLVLAEQAFDAQGHVVQAPGGVQPRAENETQVGGSDAPGITPGHFQQRAQARAGAAGADARQALVHQDAVVGVQRHHVGDAAQGHQVEQLGQVRLRRAATGEPVQLAQARAQGEHHVEDHADPGHRLAGEFAARLVGVNDGVRRRQLRARQVVVGDQHAQPGGLGRGHAVDAGDAVVHGDQQLRAFLQGDRDYLRGQPVAVFEAVRHQVVDPGRAEQAQGQHADAAGGGAVGVEVADVEDALALLQGVDQQLDGGVDALEHAVRDQSRQALVQFLGGLHATGGVEAGQQWRQVAEVGQGFRQRAGVDAHQSFPILLFQPDLAPCELEHG